MPSRRRVVGAVLVAAAAMGGAASTPWVRATAWTPLAERAVVGTGLDAVSVVGAAAVVVLASGVLLAIAGRRTAVVAGLTIAVMGVVAVLAVVGVVAAPEAVAVAAAREAFGVGDVAGVRLTAWPWVALVLAGMTVAAGVGAAVAARGWGGGVARHDRARPRGPARGPRAGEGDDVTAWDALTRGEDPT